MSIRPEGPVARTYHERLTPDQARVLYNWIDMARLSGCDPFKRIMGQPETDAASDILQASLQDALDKLHNICTEGP